MTLLRFILNMLHIICGVYCISVVGHHPSPLLVGAKTNLLLGVCLKFWAELMILGLVNCSMLLFYGFHFIIRVVFLAYFIAPAFGVFFNKKQTKHGHK